MKSRFGVDGVIVVLASDMVSGPVRGQARVGAGVLPVPTLPRLLTVLVGKVLNGLAEVPEQVPPVASCPAAGASRTGALASTPNRPSRALVQFTRRSNT